MNKKNIAWKRCLFMWLPGILLALGPIWGASTDAETLSVSKLPPLIFVRVPVAVSETQDGFGLPPLAYSDGCQIVRLLPVNSETTPLKVKVLTEEFVSACDPSVSFDAKHILFAGKKSDTDSWQIWLMNADGTGKKQITDGTGNCISPLYIGSLFHLDDKAPTRKMAYVKDGNLYTCDLDGGNPFPITFNPFGDYSPDVFFNGRILFSSNKTEKPKSGPVDLLAVNIDGTDLMGYLTGFDVPGPKEMVRVGSDGRVYFIHNKGQLAYISQRRPKYTYKALSTEKDGIYHSPCPLPNGDLIFSHRNKDSKALFTLNLLNNTHHEATESREIYKIDDYHCIDAQVLAARQVVQGRSSFVERKMETGVFYCLNVYISDRPEMKKVKPGSVMQVKILTPEGVLGVAPVESDGSFHIMLPAEKPVAFELLGKKGETIMRQHTWTWVMPRESRGCIGCHEDRELSPPNRMVKALLKPAVELPPHTKNKEAKQNNGSK